MLQRQIPHPVGTFPRCRCGAEPRHIEAHGATLKEPCDPFHPAGTRHAVECRCGAHTAWLPTLDAADRAWRQHFAAFTPDPPQTVSRIVRPLLRPHTRPKETA